MARLSNLSEVTQQISGRSKIKAQEEDWLHCLCSQPVHSVTCFGHWASMQLMVSLQRMLALTSPPAALPLSIIGCRFSIIPSSLYLEAPAGGQGAPTFHLFSFVSVQPPLYTV